MLFINKNFEIYIKLSKKVKYLSIKGFKIYAK